MKKIKHTDTLIVSKEELVAFQLRYILIDHKPITETEFNVLAYVYLYGRQAIDKVVKAEILSNDKTVENIISKFRKKGLIHGIGKKTSKKLNWKNLKNYFQAQWNKYSNQSWKDEQAAWRLKQVKIHSPICIDQGYCKECLCEWRLYSYSKRKDCKGRRDFSHSRLFKEKRSSWSS